MKRSLIILSALLLALLGLGLPATAAPPTGDKTPPTAVSFSPANGATNVSVSVAPSVLWSEPLQASSIVWTFKNAAGGKAATVAATQSLSGNTVTLSPTAPLSYSTTYNLTMKAKDLAGNTSINYAWSFVTAPVPPPDKSPVAALAVTPLSGNTPLTVTADASASTDTDTTPIASYNFDFGDGTVTDPQANATASHTYISAGSFTVKVTVTDSGGLFSSTTTIVSASTPPPPPDFAPVAKLSVSPATGVAPITATIDASASTDTDVSPIASYAFDFGDGSTTAQSTPTITHSYNNPGSYAVMVTVTDTAGLSSTASGTVIASAPNQPPVAQLAMNPSTANAPVVVTADASASTDDADGLSYVFDFGDGTVLPAQVTASASHRYGVQGTFTVTVTVTDAGGLTSQALATETVGAPPAAPTNSIQNASSDTARTTSCPYGSGWTGGTVGPCPAYWYTAAHGGGVNTSTYVWSTDAYTGSHSMEVLGTGFDPTTCAIGSAPSTLPKCGTAAWNFSNTSGGSVPVPVTAGAHYLYTDWYKADADTEVDSSVYFADGSIGYYYLATVPPAATWSQVRSEFDVPATNSKGSPAVNMQVYHLVYQNTTLFTDDVFWGQYTPAPFDQGMVSVTFDDGFTDQYTNALPVLNQTGIKGTFYIISGYLSAQPEYMTSQQITAIQQGGGDIQSHTVTHPNLTKLTPDQLTAELQNSQQVLTNTFGGPISDLAAPYGTQNTDTDAAAQQYYTSQRTTDAGSNARDFLDPYRLRAVTVRPGTSPAQVQAWINQAAQNHTWLILVYHQIDTDPSVLCSTCYGTTPANFSTEMSAVASSGLKAMPVGQALRTLAPQAGVVLTPPAPVSPQLIVNPSFEQPSPLGTQPANWLQGYWGTNTHQFTWSTDARTGSRSSRVEITSWTSGQAKWYYPAVRVTEQHYYVFDDWYKSNVDTSVSISWITADGTVHSDNQNKAIPASPNGWTHFTLGALAPPGAVSAFFAHAVDGVGWLETDDQSMTQVANPTPFTRPIVSLAFDDGTQSQLQAFNTAASYGYRISLYLPTEGIDKDSNILTSTQLRALYAQGDEIGGHSIDHSDMTTLSPTQLQQQVAGCKTTLEKILGPGTVKTFASPFGYYNSTTIAAMQSAGYSYHRTADPGYNTSYDLNPWLIRVQNMYSTTTTAEFTSWVNAAVAGHYYLVILYHEVTNTPTGDPGLDALSTTPALFQQQLDVIKASGATVLPIRDAMTELLPQRMNP